MCVCNGTDWCTLNQDCTSLGYKKQSCPELSIKCPFDTSYVYCMGCPSKYQYCSGENMQGSGKTCGTKYENCACVSGYIMKDGVCVKSCDASYKYTCSGTGYSGGSGTACDGKYTACTCASGYKWDSGVCVEDVIDSGDSGDDYYEDTFECEADQWVEEVETDCYDAITEYSDTGYWTYCTVYKVIYTQFYDPDPFYWECHPGELQESWIPQHRTSYWNWLPGYG